MIPGKEITLGDKTYVLPPLSLGMLRQNSQFLDQMKHHDAILNETDLDSWRERLDIQGSIVLAALRRNYDASVLSDEDFWNLVDLDNIRTAWAAAMALTMPTPGEVLAAMARGTSMESTPLSPLPTDGTTE